MNDRQSGSDREGFGEASLGEARSSDPPPDPEMLEDRDEVDFEDLEDLDLDDDGYDPDELDDDPSPWAQ